MVYAGLVVSTRSLVRGEDIFNLYVAVGCSVPGAVRFLPPSSKTCLTVRPSQLPCGILPCLSC